MNNAAGKGFHYTVSDEALAEHARRTVGERLAWVWDTMQFVASLQTPEERRRTLIAKWDKNILYYLENGFPAHAQDAD